MPALQTYANTENDFPPQSAEFMALKEISQHLEAKIVNMQTQIQTLADSTPPKRKGEKSTNKYTNLNTKISETKKSTRNMYNTQDPTIIAVVSREQETQTVIDEASRFYFEDTNDLKLQINRLDE